MNKRVIIISFIYLVITLTIAMTYSKANEILKKENQELKNQKPKIEYIVIKEEKDIWRIASEIYEIEYELLKAIATHETGHFRSRAWNELNNPGGIMSSKGLRRYNTKEQGVMEMARLLKLFYLDQGLTTIPQIQKKYAPLGADNDPNNINSHWTRNVTSIYNRLKNERK